MDGVARAGTRAHPHAPEEVSRETGSQPFQFTSGSTFTAGNPERLFDKAYAVPLALRNYDVSPDGQRFLMIKDRSGDEKASALGAIVVERWFEDLRQRVPTR